MTYRGFTIVKVNTFYMIMNDWDYVQHPSFSTIPQAKSFIDGMLYQRRWGE